MEMRAERDGSVDFNPHLWLAGDCELKLAPPSVYDHGQHSDTELARPFPLTFCWQNWLRSPVAVG